MTTISNRTTDGRTKNYNKTKNRGIMISRSKNSMAMDKRTDDKGTEDKGTRDKGTRTK